jgi:hypothetical protein
MKSYSHGHPRVVATLSESGYTQHIHTHRLKDRQTDTVAANDSPPASWIHFATQSCFMSQVQRVVKIAPEMERYDEICYEILSLNDHSLVK